MTGPVQPTLRVMAGPLRQAAGVGRHGTEPVGVAVLALVISACVCACSGGERPPSNTGNRPALRSIPEARALELIDDWLTEAAYIGRPGWVVAISEGAHLEVDVRLGTSNFGVEWVTADDRERYGSALPRPAPGGQLRLLHAPDGSQILVLDHEIYRSARENTLDRTVVLSDAEMNLRRDVLDFINYIQTQ